MDKGKKVAFVMVRERNQSQLAFSNKSSTESQPSRKLFRAIVQLDAHDQEGIKNGSTVTTHNPLPGISSIVSEDNQNDKLQSDPSRDGHGIENVVEPIPPNQKNHQLVPVRMYKPMASRQLKFRLYRWCRNWEMTHM